MRSLKLAIAAISLSVLTACATVVSGTQQSLFIDTPQMEGAKCKLHDAKNGQWYLPDTPGNVSVQKGNGPMSIVCSKPGFETTSLSVDEAFQGATLGNIILGGGIGIFVDAASGAAQKYPDTIIVWMKPKSFASTSARKSWYAEKAAYEAKVKAEAEAKRQAEQRTHNNG